MPHLKLVLVPFSVVLLVVLAPVVNAATDLPLFKDSDTLHITLEFPVKTIVRQKKDKPVVDGVLRYTDTAGKPVEIAMSMTTRGKSRLEYCSFPPLSLNLKRKQTKDTLFAGQNKLKIVTHCKKGKTQQRYLLQEYGIYRAFNVISDYSYRARWLKITYVDTDGKRDDEVHDAFFIESHNEVANRHGMERSRVPSILPEQLDVTQSAKYTLFQYLIANTDWSMLKGPGEDGCCHNGKVIITPGTVEGWIVLPYDFDQAGLIKTSYSSPAPALKLKSVRQRVYRGRCLHNDALTETIALFNEKREEIEAALNPEDLDGRTRNTALKYINEFYKTINTEKSYTRRIVGVCVGKKAS